MSNIVPAGRSVAPFSDVEGLEDVTPTDLVMPIIKVDHHSGRYINTNTKEEFTEFTAVLLGLVKQRVLWPPELPDDDSRERPLCRSYDFTSGHPNMEKFPWAESKFQPNPLLPCLSCPLKEWESHPNRSAPWCSEQHVYYMLQMREDGTTSPLILTIQRSGLKDSRKYFSAFFNEKRPLFFNYATLALEGHKRGANPYYIPKFTRGPDTPVAEHPGYATIGRQIRTFLQTPFQDDTTTSDESDPDADLVSGISEPSPVTSAPAPTQPGIVNPLAQATPPPAAAAAAVAPDDLPF